MSAEIFILTQLSPGEWIALVASSVVILSALARSKRDHRDHNRRTRR